MCAVISSTASALTGLVGKAIERGTFASYKRDLLERLQ